MSLRLALPAIAILALPTLALAAPSSQVPPKSPTATQSMGSMPGMRSMPSKHHPGRNHVVAKHSAAKH